MSYNKPTPKLHDGLPDNGVILVQRYPAWCDKFPDADETYNRFQTNLMMTYSNPLILHVYLGRPGYSENEDNSLVAKVRDQPDRPILIYLDIQAAPGDIVRHHHETETHLAHFLEKLGVDLLRVGATSDAHGLTADGHAFNPWPDEDMGDLNLLIDSWADYFIGLWHSQTEAGRPRRVGDWSSAQLSADQIITNDEPCQQYRG